MMPRVRFTRWKDGMSIAYSTLGEEPPLVLMPALLFSQVEKMWELLSSVWGWSRRRSGGLVIAAAVIPGIVATLFTL